MKRLLLITALVLSCSAMAQAQKSKPPVECENMPTFTYSPVNNSVMYSQVIEVQDKTLGELYDLTRAWLPVMFNNPQKGIVYEDTQAKAKLIYNGVMMSELTDAIIRFTLDFTFKDGKMRVEIKSITMQLIQANVTKGFNEYIESTDEGGKRMQGLRCDVVKEIDTNFKKVLEHFEKHIQVSSDDNF